MSNTDQEIKEVRFDIAVLRTLIDVALDNGAGSEDLCLQACASVLNQRTKRLEELEHITLYVSRGTP